MSDCQPTAATPDEDVPEVSVAVAYRWDCDCGWVNYRELQPDARVRGRVRRLRPPLEDGADGMTSDTFEVTLADGRLETVTVDAASAGAPRPLRTSTGEVLGHLTETPEGRWRFDHVTEGRWRRWWGSLEAAATRVAGGLLNARMPRAQWRTR